MWLGLKVDGAKLGLKGDGRRLGRVVGETVGDTDGRLLETGSETGLYRTNPSPVLNSRTSLTTTSLNPSPSMSPAPLTTTPPPVITTPCEGDILVTLVIFIVFWP